MMNILKNIKIFKESSSESNKKDFILAKRMVEIILYLIAAIQLFQEFSSSRYFDQFLIILSMTGMCVYAFGTYRWYSYTVENFETEYYTGHKEMMDFHTNFIASMFIPMMFLFHTDSDIFNGTSLWDLDSMKLIILMIAFISLLYYRFLVYLSKRYGNKISSDEEYEDSISGIKYYIRLLNMSYVGFLIDIVLCMLNLYLVISMEWKNVYFSKVTFDTFFTLFICIYVLFFINDKKHIALYVTIAVAISSVSYSFYMQFSETRYHDFGTVDYICDAPLKNTENTYVDIACRFETDENSKGVYKCYMTLFEKKDDGLEVVEEAIAYGNYEAIEYKNSFFQWQDRLSDTYIKKKKLNKGEKPLSFRIIDEVIEYDENGRLKEFITGNKNKKTNFDDQVTEPLIIGDGYIEFRGNRLDKIDEIFTYIDEKFDNIKK